jgi:hypothetical protein
MTDRQVAGLLLVSASVSIVVFMIGTAVFLWLLRHDYRILRARAIAEARLQMATSATFARLRAAAREAMDKDE